VSRTPFSTDGRKFWGIDPPKILSSQTNPVPRAPKVGTGNPETGKIWGHHHPKFDIDERCLGIGVEVMVGAALQYLEENAG